MKDVRVYDFSEPLGGYPRLYSDTFLNASCDLYTSGELPDVILHKIEGLQFSPEKFVNKDIVQFVTETLLTPFVAQNPELGAKMRSIVQTSILNAGAEVRISKRVDDDIDIKNRINMVLINDDSDPVGKYEALLLPFLDSLNSDKEKAMVGFLLGRMARNGVLGYEYSSQNQANILFYSLAKTCFSRLDLAAFIDREQDGGQGFLRDLERGVCMDTLSKEFEVANPFVRNVFAKAQEIQM